MPQPRTDFWLKPIPLRQFDWSATLPDYEPGDPIGYGKTEDEAIADLLDQLDDSERYFWETSDD